MKNNNNKKVLIPKVLTLSLLSIFLFLFNFNFISAEQSSSECSLPPVQQGTTIELTRTCANCTYANLTRVVYPNNTFSLLGEFEMTKNGTNYNYSYGDTLALGKYYYSTKGDLNGATTIQTCSFEVTPSGQSGNENLVFFIFVILLLYGITFTGFFGKNIPITVLGGMAMLFLGVYLINHGIIIYRDNLTNYIAYLTIGVGFITSIWALLEQFEVI